MLKTLFSMTALAALMTPAFAADGTALINQSTVNAAGGFPYHITQTGSYRLSGNLVASSTSAIVISAGNVTLDLNGFTITCAFCIGAPGISSSGVMTTIENGFISGFSGSSGIEFSAASARVDHVVEGACATGFSTTGPDLTITNSTATGNNVGIGGSAAIVTVVNSVVSNNGQDGIDIFSGLVTGSTISGNGHSGSNTRGGIIAFGGITNVTNNIIINNTIWGIASGGGSNNLGYGSNTFGGNSSTDVSAAGGLVSMHNNVCAGASGC